MSEAPHHDARDGVDWGPPGRAIGRRGTIARLVVGILLLASVIQRQRHEGFDAVPWLLALVGFPIVLLGWQRMRTWRDPSPVHANGVVGHTICLAIGAALALTPDYAPALGVTQPAIALFYGVSMLLAVVRGYAGCEVLALSNWLMRRDDQVGCVLFTPIDHLDRAHHA